MSFTLSRLAELDLAEIADYTLSQWGEAQAAKYLTDMEACCQMLAASPLLGRTCGEIRPGLRRLERGEHVVFYRIVSTGVFVVRVLHGSMLPQRHAADEK